MIEVKDLYLAYTKDYYVLNNLNFSLPDGKQMVVVGSNDSGKTSLVRVLIGLEKPSKGEVLLKSIRLNELNYKNDIELAYLPNMLKFFENKTIRQNLEYVLKIRKVEKTNIDIRVNNAIYEYGFGEYKDFKVKELNKYQKIKLAIARASLREIELFVIDDFFEELDEKELKDVVSSIKKLIKLNNASAVVFVSNDELANMFGYKIYRLEYGSLTKGE